MHEIPKMRKKASKKNFSQSENTKSIKTPKRSGFGELFTPESFSRGGEGGDLKFWTKVMKRGKMGYVSLTRLVRGNLMMILHVK